MKWGRLFSPFQLISLLIWILFIFFSGNSPDFFKNGYMSLTMLLGSIIAGATSEGGGAVAFPVMTLIYKISPAIARDFSLLIQSFGMTAATFVIIKNKIPFSKRFLLLCLPGSFLGQLFTWHFLLDHFSPTLIKITFTSLWFSYGVILFFIKESLHSPMDWKLSKISGALIFLFSFLGGGITTLTGSGVDILTFSFATLFLGLSVNLGTPTSVILMAINSIFGILCKQFFYGGIETEAVSYWLVCLPVVIFGAPLGALYISQKTSGVIVRFLQISLLLQFVFSWFILPLTSFHKVWSLSLFVGGVFLFYFLKRMGIDKELQKNVS